MFCVGKVLELLLKKKDHSCPRESKTVLCLGKRKEFPAALSMGSFVIFLFYIDHRVGEEEDKKIKIIYIK